MAYGSANTRLQQLAVMLRLEDGSSEIDRGGLEALTLTQIVQRRRPRIEIPMCCNIIANRCSALESALPLARGCPRRGNR